MLGYLRLTTDDDANRYIQTPREAVGRCERKLWNIIGDDSNYSLRHVELVER